MDGERPLEGIRSLERIVSFDFCAPNRTNKAQPGPRSSKVAYRVVRKKYSGAVRRW
jgi:hypothetical protein